MPASTLLSRCCCTWSRACCMPDAGASVGTRGVDRRRARAVAAQWCAHPRAGDRRMARGLGMPDEAGATLDEFSTEHEWIDAVDLADVAIRLAGGRPCRGAGCPRRRGAHGPPPGFPAYGLVEAHLLTGLANLALGDRTGPRPQPRPHAAAEPDRLIFPFAMATLASSSTSSHVTKRRTARCSPMSSISCGAHRRRTSTGSVSRRPHSSAPASCGCCGSCRRTSRGRDRAISRRLRQHGQHPSPQHLLQARRE